GNTITHSKNSFLAGNISAGKVYKISGCSTTTANNILFVADRVTAGTITARGNPFTVQASETGPVTLTEYNPTDFHFVDDSLSVSPAGGGIALRPKQYRFVDRIHFSGAGAVESKFQDWYLNDVGLPPPTDIDATATNGDAATGMTLGTGLEIGIVATAGTDAAPGEWSSGIYILAMSWKLDDGQESELYVPSTDVPFGTTLAEGDYLTLTVRALGPFDERISGARIYCKIDESDDPWVLLADVSMADGARATLSGSYNAWAESATENTAYTSNFVSIRSNIDTYEGLTGSTPDAIIESFTDDNRFWDASVIGGNRCFLFGPRYKDASGKVVHYRDRIIYSKINQLDVFPVGNYIDVTGSDAEDYVAGGIYGNDLLAFKQNTLYIIDISDPLQFRMKQDQQQGKYPFRGLSRPGAYFETAHGPAWCNRYGLWLYNGAEIIDLMGERVQRSKHPLAYQGYMEFDGSDDKIVTGTDANLAYNDATPLSLEAWFRTTNTGTNKTIIGLWQSASSTNDDIINLQMNSGTLRFYIIEDWSTQYIAVTTDNTYNDGLWHHVVATFDGTSLNTGMEIYVDGALAGITRSGSGVVTGFTSTNTLAMGNSAKWQASTFFEGDVALGRLWNRELSAAEIALLAAGQPVAAADQWGNQTELQTSHTNNGGYDVFTSGDANTISAERTSGAGAPKTYS
ncbi:hypothetical protein LCGC14_2090750, partial [marine sediment metagenome]